MATVRVNIMGNVYTLACGDGEEHSLEILAKKVNKKYEDLGLKASRVPENLSFAIISMSLIDEVENLKSEIEKTKNKPVKNEEYYTTNKAIISTIDELSDKIYAIAKTIKNS